MRFYPKTMTLFYRDDDLKVIEGRFRKKEFVMVAFWHVTQKIDGQSGIFVYGKDAGIYGRTAKTVFNDRVLEQLEALYDDARDAAEQVMYAHKLESISYYGEVYGFPVHSGGKYRNDVGFAVFDVLVDQKIWLKQTDAWLAAEIAGLENVPYFGILPTNEIIDWVKAGVQSDITSGEPFIAEGLVAKSGLFDNMGRAVNFKLKTKDFG